MTIDPSCKTLLTNDWLPALISLVYFSTSWAGCTSAPQHAVQLNPSPSISTPVASSVRTTTIATKTPPPETRECRKPVLISEMMINPEASVDKFGEYIELINLGTETVSMNNWKLRNNRDQEYHFPNISLLPGKTLILGGSLDPDLTADVAVELMWKDFSLPNKRGLLHLSDPCGTSIDRVQYAENPPWPRRRAGRSIERAHYSSSAVTPHKLWRLVQSRRPSGDFGSPGVISRKTLNHLRTQIKSDSRFRQVTEAGHSSETTNQKGDKRGAVSTHVQTPLPPEDFHHP